MKKQSIPIAAEGYPFIGFLALITLVCAGLDYPVISLPALLCTGFCLYFFRDPERISPEDDSVIVAPADGRIILVEKSSDERFVKEEALKISIFMNLLNVHVNRIPFPGRVKSVRFSSGRFYSADTERAALENEWCALVIDTDRKYSYTVVQIAGLIARRIVCRAEPGEVVNLGQRFGLIYFGSRLDVYLPPDTKVQVEKDQKVRAGETALGYFRR
ncbi:MAG: phosphatidylserine decarboxylase family protein [Thermodesulfobacteriota bacterium]